MEVRERLRRRLMVRRQELLNALQKTQQVLTVAEPLEQEEDFPAVTRDRAVPQILNRMEYEELESVLAALGRLRDGTYGECAECRCEISPARLAAIPWAARCHDCEAAVPAGTPRGWTP